MKSVYFIGGLLACLSFSFSTPETTANKTTEIHWLTLAELETKQQQEPRKVLFSVYTDWCGWCKKMDKEVFAETEIAKFINQNFYAVKFNAESKKSIKFNNTEYRYVPAGRRRGVHQLVSSLAKGNVSFPTTIFLNQKFEPISIVRGFQNQTNMKQVLASINTIKPVK